MKENENFIWIIKMSADTNKELQQMAYERGFDEGYEQGLLQIKEMIEQKILKLSFDKPNNLRKIEKLKIQYFSYAKILDAINNFIKY